jgi:hypothetical protein
VGENENPTELFHDLVAEFFDDRVREDVFGDAFDQLAGVFLGKTIQTNDEKFALADVLDFVIPKRRKSALNRLPLWIEHRGFEHDPNVSLHPENYSKPADFAAARNSSCKRRFSSAGRKDAK